MTVHFSPIGAIPVDFPFLDELFAKARISTQETEKIREQKPIFPMDWSIVADDSPVHRTKPSSAGSSSVNEHRRFQMILDYLAHLTEKHGGSDRTNLLLVAMGKSDELKCEDGEKIPVRGQIQKFYDMPWRDVHNSLSVEGVVGYDLLGGHVPLPSFD